jgi:hypothetical protein
VNSGKIIDGIIVGIISVLTVGWLVYDYIPASSAPGWAKAAISLALLIGDALYWVWLAAAIWKG